MLYQRQVLHPTIHGNLPHGIPTHLTEVQVVLSEQQKLLTIARTGLRLCLGVLFNNTGNYGNYTVSVTDEWMGVKYWWKDNKKGMQKYSKKNTSHFYTVYQKSYWDYPWVETGIRADSPGISCLSYGTENLYHECYFLRIFLATLCFMCANGF